MRSLCNRHQRALFVAIFALGTLCTFEVAAFLALWVRDAALPSPGLFRAERETAAASTGDPTAAGASPAPTPALHNQVLHPFVGYVEDPDSPRLRWPVTPQGFPQPPFDREAPDDRRFVVGVFGGSVAASFCFAGRERLRSLLADLPQVRGKAFELRCFANGGYKQPQQVLALNYALTLGVRFDVVIALDGFNEMALSIAENAAFGVYPFYPRSWSQKVEGLVGGEDLREHGRLALALEARRGRTRLCARPLLAWSSACHLLWSTLDRRLGAKIQSRELALARRAKRQNFLSHGPKFRARPPAEMRRLVAEHWARCSALMADLCRARGFPYFHFLQPNQYLEGSKPMSPAERAIALDGRSPYGPPIAAGYPLLIQAGEELRREGVAFHDLTGIFRDHPEPLYADSCCHFSRRGTVLLAERIGRTVAAELKLRVTSENLAAAGELP